MASTVFMLNAGVIAFALTMAIATFPTFADQTPCTAETTSRCRKDNLIVNTTVIHGPDHDANDSTEYEMEVRNHIIIVRRNNDAETVTTGSPTLPPGYDSVDGVTVTSSPDTGSNYTWYDGLGSYKLHRSKTNWTEAKRICEEEGAHLVIINSKEEEDIVRRVLFGEFLVFVGFRYQQQGGYYETVLGEPLDAGYINWDKTVGAPSTDGECGVFWWIKGEISNFQCGTLLPFVCEQRA